MARVLLSHWSRIIEALFSLVDIMMLLRQLFYAIKTQLNGGCTERTYYHRRPYAIKTLRKARNAPQLGLWVSLWYKRAGISITSDLISDFEWRTLTELASHFWCTPSLRRLGSSPSSVVETSHRPPGFSPTQTGLFSPNHRNQSSAVKLIRYMRDTYENMRYEI